MEYILTLKFDIVVETGDKDIDDIEKAVVSSYSNYCGEPVIVIDRVIKL